MTWRHVTVWFFGLVALCAVLLAMRDCSARGKAADLAAWHEAQETARARVAATKELSRNNLEAIRACAASPHLSCTMTPVPAGALGEP